MKNNFHKIMLTLLCFVMGVGMSWAETEDIVLSNGVFDTDHITWSGTYCNITQAKGTSGTYVNASYIAEPRWFAGHKIAFKAKDGFTLTGATIVCTSDDNATALKNSTYSEGVSASVDASTVTVTCSGDFVIDMGAQAKISSITINYEETKYYTIAWIVNGKEVKSEELVIGAPVVAPEVNPIEGKVLYGWAATANVDAENPVTVIPSSRAIGDATYYAVFATKTPAVHGSDVLNRETIGVTGTSYENWSGKTATDGTDAVYAGNSAGDNNSIQLRSSNSNSGIVSTTSAGKVKKVSVVWNSSTTNGRTLNVYGSNTAYTAAKDLYNTSTDGDLLGTIVCNIGASPALTISGDYEYIGLRSASGAMYLTSVTIEWETVPDVYSDFTTTVATSTDFTISAAGYATFFDATHAVTLPTGVTGYVFTAANGLEEAYSEGKVVPAGEPLVLGGAATTYTLNYTTSSEDTWKSIGKNDLCGAATDMTASEMASANSGMGKFYALSLNAAGEASSVGFYWVNEGGTAFDISAGKAYLALPAGTQARSGYAFNEETNAINTIGADAQQTVTYNLNGMRVDDNAKGFVIRNGKKCVVK